MSKRYFDKITSSVEKLAEKLVHEDLVEIKEGKFEGCYWPYFMSTIVEGEWSKKEDAIKATIDKLNEVQDE